MILTEIDLRDPSVRTEAKLSAESFDRWGCSWSQYLQIRGKPAARYRKQKSAARARGIGWEFNLWQWWLVWQQSGKWTQRGNGQGYAMCRKGDVGPYAVDNVYIATISQNSQDYWATQRAAVNLEAYT